MAICLMNRPIERVALTNALPRVLFKRFFILVKFLQNERAQLLSLFFSFETYRFLIILEYIKILCICHLPHYLPDVN